MSDPILDRIRNTLPECLPRYGTRWEQYLLTWEPAVSDPTGGVRRKLRELRRELRAELGLDVAEATMAWDRRIHVEHYWILLEKDYYDRSRARFRVEKYLEDTRADFGPVDATCLWQSYPRLGLDNRNQYDYYRDLPGGMDELRRMVEGLHDGGVRAFLNYNPWDVGTRREQKPDPDTLADFLRSTGADGVFLDTIEATEQVLLSTLHAVRSDIAVCPELIPPLPDLRTVSGSWQQFAHPSPPLVLAHRWLDPRFCLRYIDRYAKSHREGVAVSFLHGNGHVVWENVFGWWNPWSIEDRLFLKRVVALQRAYEQFFADPDWEPYVPTGSPDVHAMEWHHGDATLFTLYNAGSSSGAATIDIPEASRGALTDLWQGRAMTGGDGKSFRHELGPGEVGCVLAGPAAAPISFPSDAGDERRHRPVTLAAYLPRPAGHTTDVARRHPPEVSIPGGRYVMRVRRACEPNMEGGTYADISHPTSKAVPDQYYWLAPYRIDRTPVTKGAYAEFLRDSRYRPLRLDRFLDDWEKPGEAPDEPSHWTPPGGTSDHPVVWVSLDDARAYASWAGLRLPTEAEWQLAAEGPDALPWPWGTTFEPTRCNGDSSGTQSVFAHPDGASAWGCLDMSGNVWEWTESERDDGHIRYAMVRGGSHLRVTGSIWYTASGAQPCDVHEKVPLLDAGIDRLATVGFRCVEE
jgi:formylglycine-generating enzyme required for sulfatase activity